MKLWMHAEITRVVIVERVMRMARPISAHALLITRVRTVKLHGHVRTTHVAIMGCVLEFQMDLHASVHRLTQVQFSESNQLEAI